MVSKERELSDAQWLRIKSELPREEPSPRGGRRRIDDREVLEGILWVLLSGARWKDLPTEYHSATTCWRRLREWEDAGVWLAIWRAFLAELDEAGQLNWHEVFKGYEAYGGGRRPGCASRNRTCLGDAT